MKAITFPLIIASLWALTCSAEFHLWTLMDGRQIRAQAISKTDTTVTLQREDRKTGIVPLSMFSDVDLKYIQSIDFSRERLDPAKVRKLVAEIESRKPMKGRIGTPGTHVLRIEGKVLQVIRDGLLLSNWSNYTLEPYGAFGGSHYMRRNLLVVGATDGFVDGEFFSGVVYPAGTHRYTSVMGASLTVHRYATSAKLAAEILLRERNQKHDITSIVQEN